MHPGKALRHGSRLKMSYNPSPSATCLTCLKPASPKPLELLTDTGEAGEAGCLLPTGASQLPPGAIPNGSQCPRRSAPYRIQTACLTCLTCLTVGLSNDVRLLSEAGARGREAGRVPQPAGLMERVASPRVLPRGGRQRGTPTPKFHPLRKNLESEYPARAKCNAAT